MTVGIVYTDHAPALRADSLDKSTAPAGGCFACTGQAQCGCIRGGQEDVL